MSFLRKRLDDCLHNHKGCQQSSSTLPKRIIDIGIDCNSIKLVESRYGATGSYVALSHCWGDGEILTTTKRTLRFRKTKFGWASMPRTFQDAITITRMLGLNYLWIDSICIVQDDRLDWETQSLDMATIYQNAHLTIAASMSRHSGISFLTERSKDISEKITLEYPSESGNTTIVKARQALRCGLHYQEGYCPKDWKDPLDDRAWALQETILSTRIISYTKGEVQWACNDDLACECEGDFMGSRLRINWEGDDFYKCWHYILKEYTSRRLSFETDKLPALAGIASRIYKATGSTYLAGIWKDNAIFDLCFRVCRSGKGKRPKSYLAPTFSWASIDAPIDYEILGFEPGILYTTVVDGRCIPKGTNPFGEVSDGFMVSRGPILRAKLSHPFLPFSGEFLELDAYTLRLQGSNSLLSVIADAPLLLGTYCKPFRRKETAVRSSKWPDMLDMVPIYCLNIGLFHQASGPNQRSTWAILIILSKSVRVRGSYERIGYAKLDFESERSKPGATTKFLSWLEGKGRTSIKIV